MRNLKTIKNKTKSRNATPNEIAKAIIIDKLQTCFYFKEMSKALENLNEAEEGEVVRHLEKHISAIEKKLNLTDKIALW